MLGKATTTIIVSTAVIRTPDRHQEQRHTPGYSLDPRAKRSLASCGYRTPSPRASHREVTASLVRSTTERIRAMRIIANTAATAAKLGAMIRVPISSSALGSLALRLRSTLAAACCLHAISAGADGPQTAGSTFRSAGGPARSPGAGRWLLLVPRGSDPKAGAAWGRDRSRTEAATLAPAAHTSPDDRF